MGGRDHSCEVCGHGGFNDPHGDCICEPAPDPFTDQDREFLEKQIVAYRANTFADCFSGEDAEALARALAYIDHLEGEERRHLEAENELATELAEERTRCQQLEEALRSADELARAFPGDHEHTDHHPALIAYLSARAVLRTSEDAG